MLHQTQRLHLSVFASMAAFLCPPTPRVELSAAGAAVFSLFYPKFIIGSCKIR
jgi:hypothetical protein